MKKFKKAAVIFTLIFVSSLGIVGKAHASIINTLGISIQNPPTPPTKPEPPLPPRIPTPTPRATPKPTSGPESGNQGGSSSGGAGAPYCGATKPGTPTILSSVRSGNSQTLTWSSVANATYYSIVYGTTPGVYQYGVANVGNVTSYTVNALAPRVTYHFSVNAVNDCMPGDPSTPGGRVLGASTMAGTGSFAENLYMIVMGIGGVVTVAGAKDLKKVFKRS
jgi:hypothetical protein